MRYLWEFESLISGVSIEFLLEEVWERPQHLLDDEQLVDLAVSWEQRLAVHELAHDAADGPDIHLFTIWEIF